MGRRSGRHGSVGESPGPRRAGRQSTSSRLDGGEEEETQGVEGAKERTAHLDAFESAIREALARQQQQSVVLLHEALGLPPPEPVEAKQGEQTLAAQSIASGTGGKDPVVTAFELGLAQQLADTMRSIHEAGATLQETGVAASRSQLKQAKVAFALKLETTRTAGDVQLSNQKLNMEATFEEKLHHKVQELSSNEGALTAQLNQRIEDLAQKLQETKIKREGAEDALATCQKSLHDAEAKAAGADKEIEGLKEAGEQLRTELANVKTELESTKGENASLAQQVEGLSENLREVEGERDALRIELEEAKAEAARRIEELEAERDAIKAELDAAAAKAEAEAAAAAEAHANEMRELEEAHAAHLAAEVEKAVASERAEGQAREAALNGQIATLTSRVDELESKLASTESQLKESRAEAKAAHQALADAKAEFEKLSAGAVNKLKAAEARIAELEATLKKTQDELATASKELKEKTAESAARGEQVATLTKQYEAAKAEIEDSRRQLQSALKDLNITKDENKSLGEQIKELIDTFANSKREIEESRAALEVALKDLNITRDENMTLGEQVKVLIDKSESAGREIASATAELSTALRESDAGASKSDPDRMMLVQLADLLQRFRSLRFAAQNEGAELKKLRGELADAMTSVGTLTNEKGKLMGQVSKLEADVQKIREQFAFAFHKLNIANNDKRNLADQMGDLAKNYKEALTELDKIRGELSEALSSIGVLSNDKRNLSEQVADLADNFKEAKLELAKITSALADALASIEQLTRTTRGLTKQKQKLTTEKEILNGEKGKLSDRVAALIDQHKALCLEMETTKMTLSEALKGIGVLTGDKRRLTDVKLQLSSRVQDLVDRYRDAQLELDILKRSFVDSLHNIEGLTGEKISLKNDKRSLKEQIGDLVESYKEAKAELRAALIEKQVAMTGEQEATNRAYIVKQEAAHERTRVVQAALASMQELRAPVQTTASGLRMRMPITAPGGDHDLYPDDHSREAAGSTPSPTPLLSLPEHARAPSNTPDLMPPSPPTTGRSLPTGGARHTSASVGASPRLKKRGLVVHSRVSPSKATDIYDRMPPPESSSTSAPPMRRLPVLPLGAGAPSPSKWAQQGDDLKPQWEQAAGAWPETLS